MVTLLVVVVLVGDILGDISITNIKVTSKILKENRGCFYQAIKSCTNKPFAKILNFTKIALIIVF